MHRLLTRILLRFPIQGLLKSKIFKQTIPCCRTPHCSPILGLCENIINCRDQNGSYRSREHPRAACLITQLEDKAARMEPTNLYEYKDLCFGNVCPTYSIMCDIVNFQFLHWFCQHQLKLKIGEPMHVIWFVWNYSGCAFQYMGLWVDMMGATVALPNFSRRVV